MTGSERLKRSLAEHEVECACAGCKHSRSCEALLAFAKEHDMISNSDIGDSVAKLISNLGHFCEARELDFIVLVQQGVSRWRAEIEADEFAQVFTAKLTLAPKSAAQKKKHFIKL